LRPSCEEAAAILAEIMEEAGFLQPFVEGLVLGFDGRNKGAWNCGIRRLGIDAASRSASSVGSFGPGASVLKISMAGNNESMRVTIVGLRWIIVTSDPDSQSWAETSCPEVPAPITILRKPSNSTSFKFET
jgi:hypothetical protein